MRLTVAFAMSGFFMEYGISHACCPCANGVFAMLHTAGAFPFILNLHMSYSSLKAVITSTLLVCPFASTTTAFAALKRFQWCSSSAVIAQEHAVA